MDKAYSIVNALIDDLRQHDAPTIPKLKIELQLTKIKHMLLILEAQHETPVKVQDLLVRLRSTYESHPGDYERLLPFITEVAEEFSKLAYIEGAQADRRKGADGPIMMRRKEDHF
jgi:hypothetical protein